MRSLFNLKRSVYEHLPGPLRALVGYVPFSLLAGSRYREIMSSARTVDHLDRTGVERLAERRLGSILAFAVEHVPFYRPMRSAVLRLPPRQALLEFPLIDKEVVLERFNDFQSDVAGALRHYETTTGGTTGRQLKILLEDSTQAAEMGFMHRQWSRVGYDSRSRKATFRGVDFSRAGERVHWQENPIYREMQFSPMAMSEQNLWEYWRQYVAYGPQFLHGYPSAISLFARFVLRNGLADGGPRIRAALLGSEGCSIAQRELIERAFQTRVYSWYGHSERLVLAGECERSTAYHQFPDYGWLEVLKADEEPADVGEEGEIVGTGFLNRVMPLIRYRTGDFATRLDWRCDCGRCWDRVENVKGRGKQEMIVGRSGALISLTALNLHGPQFDRVARYQYYQDTPGECEIRVVPDAGFTEQDSRMIADAYAKKAGTEIDFRVRAVPELTLTERGKLKLLLSKLAAGQASDEPPSTED